MKKIIAILGIAASLLVGGAVSPNAESAQASTALVSVKNSALSTSDILTCGYMAYQCRWVSRGVLAIESGGYEARSIAIGAGYDALYRYILFSPVENAPPVYGNWEGISGGSQGVWLDINREFGAGVAAYTVEVLIDRHH